MNQHLQQVLARLDKIGLHPLVEPTEVDHHSDAPLLTKDKMLGDVLSFIMGDLFIDNNTSPIEQWATVAKALRIHGLQISDIKESK